MNYNNIFNIETSTTEYGEEVKTFTRKTDTKIDLISADDAAHLTTYAIFSEEKLKECLVEARKYGVVEISNYNTPKQLVIGGEAKAVEVAIELCKEAGARRAVPLKVSGPFHTPLLEEASVNLAKELNNIEFQDMKIPVLTNVTAEVIADSSEIKDLLIKQVKSSVKWSETIRNMIDMGIDTFIEIGPSRTLSGFLRDIDRNVTSFNVEDMKSLNKTLEGIMVRNA